MLKNLNTDFTLNNFLFRFVELTGNADLGKYKYSGCCIGFGSRSEFSFTYESVGENIIIFGADMSSCVHIGNKNKNILLLAEELTQRLDDTKLTAKPTYLIHFTQSGKRFVLRLYNNGRSSFLVVNATKIYQFKAEDSEVKNYTLCLVNISKDSTINDRKKHD